MTLFSAQRLRRLIGPRLDNRDGIADLASPFSSCTMNFDVRAGSCRTARAAPATRRHHDALLHLVADDDTDFFRTFAPLRILESGNWVIG